MMQKKKLTPLILSGIFVLMLGLSYAAVPLYDLFCRVTGFGGTTQISKDAPKIVLDKVVSVRFDTNVNNLPWDFKALKSHGKLLTLVSNLTLTTLSNTIFGASLEIWVVPPNPVTLQNKSYKGTAAYDKPNIKTKIPDSIRGVSFFFCIILICQILLYCKV